MDVTDTPVTMQLAAAQAQVRLTQILQSLNRGEYSEPTTLTVAEYLDLWLRNYAEVSVCPRVPLQCVVFALVLAFSKCVIMPLYGV